MSEAETMRMVAEVVDKSTGPVRQRHSDEAGLRRPVQGGET
jgi:hypothetical protein